MKFRYLTTIFVLSTLIFSGCVPLLHKHYYAPKVYGVLKDGDKPLRATNVYLSSHYNKKRCDTYELVDITNEQGEFEIGPIYESRYILWFFTLGEPFVSWHLCFESAGSRDLILNSHGFGVLSHEVLLVKCDISMDEEINFEYFFPDISGKCKVEIKE